MAGSIATFLMTDLEGSTRLWEREPDAMSAAVAMIDQIVETSVQHADGAVIKAGGQGDTRFAVFQSVQDAVEVAF